MSLQINQGLLPITSLVFILLYILGYLIQAITLRNYGIQQLDAITLQYIEVGITFLVLTLLLTIVPAGCLLAYLRIRKRARLPNYYLGVFGSSLNTYHLFLTTIFFALFITRQEWLASIKVFNSQVTLSQAFSCYSSISFSVVVILPLLERRLFSKILHSNKIYSLIVEPLRFSGIFSAFIFDIVLFKSFRWIRVLINQGVTYLLSSIFLFLAICTIVFYIQKFLENKTFYVLTTLGTVGALIVLYMCINAYVFGVVRHIPSNRGGSLPVSTAYLAVDEDVLYNPLLANYINQDRKTIGPVYVIETNQNYLYVTRSTGEEWFYDWVPAFSIKQDLVKLISYERIVQGGPRGQ